MLGNYKVTQKIMLVAPLIEDGVFLRCIFLPPYHKLGDQRCLGLFLDCPSYSIDLYSFFASVPYCFYYCSLQYSLKSRSLTPPAPFFFLKIALVFWSQTAKTHWGLLCFHTNFKNVCSNSVKNAIGNLIGIALTLQTSLEKWTVKK